MNNLSSDAPRFAQDLKVTAEAFRLLVQRVKDYAIFLLDPRGNVVSWNEGMFRIKGYTAEEIIGKPVSVFYTREKDALSDGSTALAGLKVRVKQLGGSLEMKREHSRMILVVQMPTRISEESGRR